MPYLPNKEVWADTNVWEKCQDSLEVISKYGVSLHAKRYEELYDKFQEVMLHRTLDKRSNVLPFEDDKGLEKDSIFSGRCGFAGLFALSLVCAYQYDEIYLLGYDFGTPNQRTVDTHWYQHLDKKLNLGSYGKTSIYLQGDEPREEISDFNEYLKSKAKIYNVSKISRIECFDKLTYEEFYDRIGS